MERYYEKYTTYTVVWQNRYSTELLKWTIIWVKNYKWDVEYDIVDNFIVLKETPKRKYKISVYCEELHHFLKNKFYWISLTELEDKDRQKETLRINNIFNKIAENL